MAGPEPAIQNRLINVGILALDGRLKGGNDKSRLKFLST